MVTSSSKFKATILGNKEQKPSSPSVDASKIPEVLRVLDRWLGWKWEWLERSDGTGKWDKPPVNAATGGYGSSTDPTTWSDFQTAFDAVQRGTCDGIGIALGDMGDGRTLSGVDIDDCRDPQSGELTSEARSIIAMLESYTEVSPSGTGIKIFCWGQLPQGHRATGDYECYDRGRYFTVTGNSFDEPPRSVREAANELKTYHRIFLEPPRNVTGLPDRQVALKALDVLKPPRVDDYWEWLRIGMALKTVDDALLPEWESWSRKSAKFTEGECEQKWRSFRGRGVTIGTLIHMANEDDPSFSLIRAKSPTRHPTDLGNAQRFAEQHGKDLIYCHQWKHWLAWDGRRWANDIKDEAMARAKTTALSIYAEAAQGESDDDRKRLAGWAVKSESRQCLKAMVALAESEAPISTSAEQLDLHPWLLNCQNGTIDLRTGQLQPHRRGNLITKICPVDYPAESMPEPVLFLKFLDQIFAENRDLIGFIQRLMGVSLVGEVVEHILAIFHGRGANGKSVLTETWCGMLGSDFAMKAPHNLLTPGHSNRHPTELADLYGKRFVVAVETADGAQLSEALVKELTGGDAIRARKMRQDFWQFKPSHTIVLATNHIPRIRGTDEGIWRRIRLVPFSVTIPEDRQDKQLAARLRDEYPAILRWAVGGCLKWQQDGLQAPHEVTSATATLRQGMDAVLTFLNECCEIDPEATETSQDLFAQYTAWAKRSGEAVESRARFGTRLGELGYAKRKSSRVMYVGLKLREGREGYQAIAA